MKRHRWNGKLGKGINNSTVSCVKCGCVRQYVGGYPTYFMNDTVYDKKAPPCPNKLQQPEQFTGSNPRYNYNSQNQLTNDKSKR